MQAVLKKIKRDFTGNSVLHCSASQEGGWDGALAIAPAPQRSKDNISKLQQLMIFPLHFESKR